MNITESIIASAKFQKNKLAAKILCRGDNRAEKLALRIRRQKEANYIYNELRNLSPRDLPNGEMPRLSTTL